MAYFVLNYDMADSYAGRTPADRDLHVAHIQASIDRGEFLLGGGFTDGAAQGMVLMEGDGPAVAESFATNDPYVKAGYVKSWRVRPFNIVMGSLLPPPAP